MKILVDENIFLTPVKWSDISSLVKYLNEWDIYKNTLTIPYPYTVEDAEWWISFVEQNKQEKGKYYHYAIRNRNSELIGGIGLHNKYNSNDMKDEIGYWLGKPFWNKGIMSKVLKSFCLFSFKEFYLTEIEAIIFDYNPASERILQKIGFRFIETIPEYTVKNNLVIQGKKYSLLNHKIRP